MQLPPQFPLAVVDVLPVSGWRIALTTRVLAAPIHTARGDVTSVVDTITWEGGEILPGTHQDFSLRVGPVPRGPTELAFKAVQTYANGETVRWIELRGPNEAVPPHPAPVLHVSPPGLSR